MSLEIKNSETARRWPNGRDLIETIKPHGVWLIKIYIF